MNKDIMQRKLICKVCGSSEVSTTNQATKINHLLHLLLSLITFFWVFVWIFLAATHNSKATNYCKCGGEMRIKYTSKFIRRMHIVSIVFVAGVVGFYLIKFLLFIYNF